VKSNHSVGTVSVNFVVNYCTAQKYQRSREKSTSLNGKAQ